MGWTYEESIEKLSVYCDRCLIVKNEYAYMPRKKCFQLMRLDGFKFVVFRGQRRLFCAKCAEQYKLKLKG